ncbi:MAG: hypothetical protein R2770_09190 [Acidimicrobiales bacterium]
MTDTSDAETAGDDGIEPETFPREYVEKLRQEITQHRHAADEARSVLDTLTDQLAPYRATRVDEQLNEVNDSLQPGGLLVDVLEIRSRGLLEDCLGADGQVDRDRTRDVIGRLVQERPYLKANPHVHVEPAIPPTFGQLLSRSAQR